jgi:hypothetical protein
VRSGRPGDGWRRLGGGKDPREPPVTGLRSVDARAHTEEHLTWTCSNF